MKRTVYEAPLTERFQVELEGVFCASVINEEGKGATVTAGAQDYQEWSGDAGFVTNDNGSIWE